MSWVWEDGLAGRKGLGRGWGTAHRLAALGCGSWGAQGEITAGPVWWEHLNAKLRAGVFFLLLCFLVFFFFFLRSLTFVGFCFFLNKATVAWNAISNSSKVKKKKKKESACHF